MNTYFELLVRINREHRIAGESVQKDLTVEGGIVLHHGTVFGSKVKGSPQLWALGMTMSTQVTLQEGFEDVLT